MAFHAPLGGGGGGGTILGTIDTNQVAYGVALNTIGGDGDFFWDVGNHNFAVGDTNALGGSSGIILGTEYTINDINNRENLYDWIDITAYASNSNKIRQ